MCGFAGEIRFDGREADLAAIQRMSETMRPRGPDGGGTWQRGPLALAHRRLTIIDLTRAGEQPMVDSELGLSLAFNGCIYNYPELRRELEAHGYRFFSTSDTEVILKAYHRWGTDCVHRFMGMFAFAIAERETGRVVLARDRLGKKPLYLARGPGRLRFASTLPALVAGGEVDASIDRTALHHYLSFHSVVPAPHTILAGVRKLPPATVAVIEPDGSERTQLYWRPSFVRPQQPLSAGAWREAVLDRLRTAVKRRLVADVPIGVLLSGGLDPVTPPAYGDEVAKTLRNSRHVVAAGYGHNVSPHACAPRLVADFIEQAGFDKLSPTCVRHFAQSTRPPMWPDRLSPRP